MPRSLPSALVPFDSAGDAPALTPTPPSPDIPLETGYTDQSHLNPGDPASPGGDAGGLSTAHPPLLNQAAESAPSIPGSRLPTERSDSARSITRSARGR